MVTVLSNNNEHILYNASLSSQEVFKAAQLVQDTLSDVYFMTSYSNTSPAIWQKKQPHFSRNVIVLEDLLRTHFNNFKKQNENYVAHIYGSINLITKQFPCEIVNQGIISIEGFVGNFKEKNPELFRFYSSEGQLQYTHELNNKEPINLIVFNRLQDKNEQLAKYSSLLSELFSHRL